jgi:peptide chain release factor 1
VLERLGELEREFDDVEARLADPDLLGDQPRYQQVAKRYRELEPLVERSRELRRRHDDLDTAREMLRDAGGDDDRQMLKGEVDEAEAAIARLTDEVRLLLLPKDPNDERNVIVEIRGAEGGEEANLFARDLFEMYRAFAARQGWKVEVLGSDPSDLGGYNEITFTLKGDGVWARMHHEAGPHRVQRVPVTESQGRIHTSSATVTVLNRAKALQVLRARLLKAEQDRQTAEASAARRGQIGGGGRSEKVRTYNFKENRVTDHRIGLTVHKLDKVLAGELDEMSDALVADEQARRLAEAT